MSTINIGSKTRTAMDNGAVGATRLPTKLAWSLFAGLFAFVSGEAADLTISDGVVVKFGDAAELAVRDRINVGNSVVFTSAKDDEIGGQVSPSPQSPAAGQWHGMRLEKSASAAGTQQLRDIFIRYAGGDDEAALTIRGLSPPLQYVQLADSTVALKLLDNASPAISGANFMRNGTAIDASASAPTITNSAFEANSVQAVINRTPGTIIQATGNWWGHITGPRDLVANPTGQGGLVSTGVTYSNYLTSAPLLNPTIRLAAPATYFDMHEVQFELSCVNALEYRIAEGTAFSGVPFQPLVGGRASVAHTLSAGDGRKNVNVQFRNSSGVIVSAALSGGVLIDSQAPTLAITNPSPGSLITDSIVVEAAASDGGGINRVLFYVNGTLRATDTSAPYAYSWNVQSLADGPYDLRVVAVDAAERSTERTHSVTLARVQPPPDTDGPTLANIRFNGSALANGATLARSGAITVEGTDRSGVSRIDLLLDDVVVATATGSGTYTVTLSLDGIANGAHVLGLRARDSLGNTATSSFNITVAHEPPLPPVLTGPANGLVTGEEQVTVTGTAPRGLTIQLLNSGAPAGDPIVVASSGQFSGVVTLAAGANPLSATAADQYGVSAPSNVRTVTRDISVPASPSNLTAQSLTAGKVRLAWTASPDPKAVGYNLYRAPSPFDAIAEAVKINNTRLTTTTFEDLPSLDGQYHYRVVAVNSVNNSSLPSNQADARSDATLPRATQIVYTPRGKVDPQTGRVGQGRVDIALTVSEALQATPYLSLVPSGGQPLTAELTQVDDTHYSGYVEVDAETASGIANALFSARDSVGNRGTVIDAGATLNIDTEGPALTGIAMTPSAPIKNDDAQQIVATFTLSKAMKSGEFPQLSYRLSGPARTPVALSGATSLTPTTWRVTFSLPTDAGQSSPETLSFAYVGIDDLDNVSNRITAQNRFQVYRGELPPLDVPLAFTAKAQPGGKVRLSWQAVPEASSYQIYRQGPSDTTLAAHQRASADVYLDQTPADGRYLYTVATVRSSNGQESISGQTAPVEVVASATAPGAPSSLALVLTGQGIRATWQPPVGSTVDSYNLYRASGTQITSVEGLTPIKTGVKQPLTVDANPSTTEHAYVVTALDAAGNESALSNSEYLNAALLPVASLTVQQIGNELPVVTWTASRSSNVAGYHVYLGPDASAVKLTPSPINGLQFTDSGFTSGERRYTVSAVDANGVEVPRSLTLPNVSMEIVSGLPILRGVMNRVEVQVVNLSTTAQSAVIVIRAGGKDHRSEPFALGANETRLVPVVVGGYTELPGVADLRVSMEMTPNEGELVRVARDTTADVGDSALVIGIATEQFTRGATGQVRLSVENTSAVEVELLTARANGAQDSNELRFKILDADGNVLATTPYRQVFGASVITLANGSTVARIPPGTRYESEPFAVDVPGASPDNVRVRLEIDKLRYHTGQSTEVVIAGRGAERQVTLIDTAYVGEVTDVSPLSSFGDQDILIRGRAADRGTGAMLANTRLKLILNQEGFERTFAVVTDATGEFNYTFVPGLTDAGLYKVSAVHPDVTDRPEQRAFTINKVTLSPSPYALTVPRNYPFSVPFVAKAGPGTQAANLRLVFNAASQPTGQAPEGVSVELPTPRSIAARQSLPLPVRFVADNTAQPNGAVVLDVFSDEQPNAPIGQVRINYTLTEARPYLTATPTAVETGLAQGTSALESVVVENKGLQDAIDLQFSLTQADGTPAPAWAAVASTANGTLPIGGKRSVDISFTPPASTAEGVYQLRLKVTGVNVAEQSLPVFASITQSGMGNVLFKAADIYTATLDKNGQLIPGLRGARVTLQNEDVPTITAELLTDQFGEAYFQALPAGRYKYRASAANHQELGGRLQVKPGITFNQPIFLDYNVVTVEWSVREISIEDRYEITLNATFETNVPAPVVVYQPTSINLPVMKPGDVFYGELTLSNYGLVRADHLVSKLPGSDQFFKYEFLADFPSSLGAKERITVPFRVISLKSLDPALNATGAGCWSYYAPINTLFDFKCANDQISNGSAGAGFFSESHSTCPSGLPGIPGPGSGGTSGPGGPGGWSGPGYGLPYTDIPGIPPCNKCENGRCCGAGNGGGGDGEGGGDGDGPGDGGGEE